MLRTPSLICLAAMLATCISTITSRADEPLSFNRDIRPILANQCFACHGPDSASRKADLRLDQRDSAIDMGAITAGQPAESELVARIFSDDDELVMPPLETKKTLTASQKEMLKRWVAEGAEYQRNWSFLVPQKPKLPTVKQKTWPKNPIDYFVLARLESLGLSPAVEADAVTLCRRLHLDITGLPPTPEDAATFASAYKNRGDAALSDLIDRLMKSTAWGEHRARYWLDAARYGDTHGLHFDNYREMWPYRDWLIRSFNANQPFDRFTVEQIAGDLLPNPTVDQLIATGFQRCNITTNEGGTIDAENLANYAADRVQTLGWVYLGLTTNCGQCHDHKFDPFTMKDYYSLAAYFANTTQLAKDGNVKDGRGPVRMVPSMADKPRWTALPNEIVKAKSLRDQRKKNARGEYQKWLAPATSESLDEDLPTDGLVVHIALNEGDGNEVASLIDTQDHFATRSDVKWDAGGKLGPAAVLKTGATFDLGDLGDFSKDQKFSYGAWVQCIGKDMMGGIIARMNEKNRHRGWDLWQNNGGFAVHIIGDWPDNGLKVATRGNAVTPGKWQHVFATYDGSGKPAGVKIFINGKEEKLNVERNSLKADASIRAKTPLRIGQRSDGAVFEGGSVQDVRIYERLLAPAEVKSIADIGLLRAGLATAADKRTPKQKASLYEHFLATRDSQYQSLSTTLANLEAEQKAIRDRSPVTHIQVEKPNSMPVAFILMRGQYDKPGEKVSAATPTALHAMPRGAPANRLGLAKWIVDESNPLTVRVTVNRFWQQVFGQGIVSTTENFGVMGAPPSHPGLLDYLAVEFREEGWDVKRFFKQILMSATYRQSAAATPLKLEKDRDNVFLSRGPRFRMDAEMVRDCALAASELLSAKMYGPGVKPYQPEGIWDIVGLPGGDTRNYVQDKGENLYRRTLYHFWKRMAPPPSLEAFNAPSREVCTVRRERTNTPLQALVTLNDPQFVEAARRLAENAMKAGGKEETKIVDFIVGRVLARSPIDREREIILTSKKDLMAYYVDHKADAKLLIGVGDSKADASLVVDELAAWTLVCNQIMNLDEALNK